VPFLPTALLARRLQEVGWYDEDRNSSGVLTSKLSADALSVKGQFGDTMGMLTQVRAYCQVWFVSLFSSVISLFFTPHPPLHSTSACYNPITVALWSGKQCTWPG
jgi:hypothetical protein